MPCCEAGVSVCLCSDEERLVCACVACCIAKNRVVCVGERQGLAFDLVSAFFSFYHVCLLEAVVTLASEELLNNHVNCFCLSVQCTTVCFSPRVDVGSVTIFLPCC